MDVARILAALAGRRYSRRPGQLREARSELEQRRRLALAEEKRRRRRARNVKKKTPTAGGAI